MRLEGQSGAQERVFEELKRRYRNREHTGTIWKLWGDLRLFVAFLEYLGSLNFVAWSLRRLDERL